MNQGFPYISDINIGNIVKENSILITLAGSKSYGTNNAGSDTDYRGVLSFPQKQYFSFRQPPEQISWKEDCKNEEGVIYEIKKFVTLALQCNPNIIECLFCDENSIVFQNKKGSLLRENKGIFLSQRAHKSFLGYALSQLKRIKGHKTWIDNPPKSAPKRSDFKLPDFKPVSAEQMSAAKVFVMRNTESIAPWLIRQENVNKEAFYESIIWIVALILESQDKAFDIKFDGWMDIENYIQDIMSESLGFNAGFIELLKMERAYSQAIGNWQSYNTWKNGRNESRAELERKYGFDTKHAMHLVRLMRMGEEILLTSDVNVYRHNDKDELIDIRNGLWKYDQLVDWAENKAQQLNDIVRAGKSCLPEEPNYELADDLVLRIIGE